MFSFKLFNSLSMSSRSSWLFLWRLINNIFACTFSQFINMSCTFTLNFGREVASLSLHILLDYVIFLIIFYFSALLAGISCYWLTLFATSVWFPISLLEPSYTSSFISLFEVFSSSLPLSSSLSSDLHYHHLQL